MHSVHDELDYPVLVELMVQKNRYPFLVLLVLALAMVSCAGGTKLVPDRTEELSGIGGQYTVYLYHFKGSDDLEGPDRIEGAVAILDPEGDAYEFDLRAPDFSYSVVRGLSGPAAADTAEVLLSRFNGRHVYSKIVVNGETVGYEARTAHPTWIYAKRSVGASYYLGEGGKIEVVFRTEYNIPDRK